MKKYKYFLLACVLVVACGKVPVNIDEQTYEPKIVVDGYLIAGEKPHNIRIMRNYGLNQDIDFNSVVLSNAQVEITHLETEKSYPLQFQIADLAFAYAGNDFIIQPGNSYRISVNAEFDDIALHTESTTTVPQAGFQIDETASRLVPAVYDSAVSNDENFNIAFTRSPDCGSYIGAITALDASLDTFIENNVLGIEKDMLDDWSDTNEMENFYALQNQSQWLQTKIAGGIDLSNFKVEWFATWFYGNYQVVLYAADANFSDYYLTHNSVMEMDGNLIEPRFHFEGDGIGVFGSAICDTAYFEILQ